VLELCVTPDDLERRRAKLAPPTHGADTSGYRRLYLDHVLQADAGCDFDFMTPAAMNDIAPVAG
jgi:L-arabonate dehydrase